MTEFQDPAGLTTNTSLGSGTFGDPSSPPVPQPVQAPPAADPAIADTSVAPATPMPTPPSEGNANPFETNIESFTPTEHKPTVIDKARTAGFSEDEIQTWANQQMPSWKKAGFSDDDIKQFLGMPTTQTRQSFVGRIADSIHQHSVEQNTQFQQDVTEAANPSRQLFIRGLGDIIDNKPASGLGEVLFGLAGWVFAPLAGILNPIERQTTKITGNPEFGAKTTFIAGGLAGAPENVMAKFATDLSVASAAARGGRLVRPGVTTDIEVGGMPRSQDFTDAANVTAKKPLGTPVPGAPGTQGLPGASKVEVKPPAIPVGQADAAMIRSKLLTLSEEHGIHPSEVAADTLKYPDVNKAMLWPDKNVLPDRYLAPKQDLFGPQADQGSFRFMNDAEQTAPVIDQGEQRIGSAYTYNRLGEAVTVGSAPVRSKLFTDQEGPYSVATTKPAADVSKTGTFRGDKGRFQFDTGSMKQGELPLGAPEHQASLDFERPTELFNPPSASGLPTGGRPLQKANDGFVSPAEQEATHADAISTAHDGELPLAPKQTPAPKLDKTVQDLEAESKNNVNQFTVAFRKPDGTIVKGKKGDLHLDVAEREGVDVTKDAARWEDGFVDKSGKFYSRQDMADHSLPESGEDLVAAQKPKQLYSYDDRGIFKKALSATGDFWKKTFQPEWTGGGQGAALRSERRFANFIGASKAERSRLAAAEEGDRQFFRKRSVEDNLDYLISVDEGKKFTDPALADQAARDRVLTMDADALEKQYGSRADFVQNYMPRYFEKPQEFIKYVQNKIGQLGPSFFTQQRAFATLRDAMESGLRLRTTNPAELITQRLIDSIDMQHKMRLLEGLQQDGLAAPWKGSHTGADLGFQGAQIITSPTGAQWALSPDIIPLWKNAVEAKGMAANMGLIGSGYRGWMALKSVWVPIKLALSAFHFLHEVVISSGSHLARAINELDNGSLTEALKALADIPKTLGTLGISDAIKGSPLRADWLKTTGRTAEGEFFTQMAEKAGFVPQVPEEFKIAGKAALERAIDNDQTMKAVPLLIRQGIKWLQSPLFETYIPNIKSAAFQAEVSSLLRRHPELLQSEENLGVSLRVIAKQIDNRFGEMNYGGVFWNKFIKEGGVASFLSLGWNLGFAREFGGAFFDPVARVMQRAIEGPPSEIQKIRQMAQNKLAFVAAYAMQSAAINGIMTYAFTGEMPTGEDWLLARIGGKNYDGTPRRITNMSYLREIPAWFAHKAERGGGIIGGALGTWDMLWNKQVFEPLVEFIHNRDYYGSQMYDKNAPAYQQAWQVVQAVFKNQFEPIPFSSSGHALSTGGTWSKDVPLAFLGFGPSPVYADRTDTQNRTAYLYRNDAAAQSRSYEEGQKAGTRTDLRQEIIDAQLSGDPKRRADATYKWYEAGGTKKGMSNLLAGMDPTVGMFHALSEEDQKNVLDNATPDERKHLEPFRKVFVARDIANLMMEGHAALQNGDMATVQAKQQQIQQIMKQAVVSGHITNLNAFRAQLRSELIARHNPDLAAIRALPKSIRPQYAPHIQTPSQPSPDQQKAAQ